MKKLIILVVCAAFAAASFEVNAAETRRWRPDINDLNNADLNPESPYYGYYYFGYLSNGESQVKSNWVKWTAGDVYIRANAPDGTDAIIFENRTVGTAISYNILVNDATTVGPHNSGASFSNSQFYLGQYVSITLAGAPLTILSNPTTYQSESQRALNVEVGASANFTNNVIIQATTGGGTAWDATGLYIPTWGGAGDAANRLVFSNLILRQAAADGAGADRTTQLSFKPSGSDIITIKKLSDYSLGTNTGILRYHPSSAGTSAIKIGNLSDWTGTIRQYSSGLMIFTENVHSNFTFSRGSGCAIKLAPENGSAMTVSHSTMLKFDTDSGNIQRALLLVGGNGTVIIPGGGTFAMSYQSDLTVMDIGGTAGDNVLLGGGFTVTTNTPTLRTVNVLAGGGLTNKHGKMTFGTSLNLQNASRLDFEFNFAAGSWGGEPIVGTGGRWLDGGVNRSIRLTATATDYFNPSVLTFSFIGGMVADESTFILLSASTGFYGTVDAANIFAIPGYAGLTGSLSIVQGTLGANSRDLVLTVYNSIPEPSAFALLGVSLLVVTVLRRRKLS